MLFLDKFWYGNVAPGERRYRSREEYNKPIRDMEKCENALMEQLHPSGMAAFKDYCEASGRAYDMEVCDAFIEGFRMGTMIILDVLHPTQKKKEGQI